MRRGASGTPRTVGVEEELLLVDRGTGRPLAVSSQVLRTAGERGHGAGSATCGGSVDAEFQRQQVETDTPPQVRMSELEDSLCSWRSTAARDARESGARLLATGTSPMPADPRLTRSPRFEEVAARFGLTAHEQLTCGCHVHVSVQSDDEAIAVIDRIRVWLPALLAISANSPFWNGRDSGYAAYRPQVLSRWPTAGPPDAHGSAAAYRSFVEAALATGVPMDEGMLYQDARPSTSYPTVEVRVPDVCADVRDTVLVAALCRGLVETGARAWSDGDAASEVPTSLLRLATWQASREGVEGDLVDPRSGRPAPAATVLLALVEHAAGALDSHGDLELVEEGVERVLREGTGATHQCSVLERTGQLVDVTAELARVTAGQA